MNGLRNHVSMAPRGVLATSYPARAIRHLASFLDLWQDPDSEQLPVAYRARALLASLVGEAHD